MLFINFHLDLRFRFVFIWPLFPIIIIQHISENIPSLNNQQKAAVTNCTHISHAVIPQTIHDYFSHSSCQIFSHFHIYFITSLQCSICHANPLKLKILLSHIDNRINLYCHWSQLEDD